VSEYRGGRLAKLGRAYTRQPRFESIQGLSEQQLAVLRQYRRAFDCSEMSPIKSALDIGTRSGFGGSDVVLQRLEVMAFADIAVTRLEADVPAHLLPVLRAVALRDLDFKELAEERFGSSSGQRRARMRSGVDALVTHRPVTAVNAAPAVDLDAAPLPTINPAFLDEAGRMLPAEEIARIIVESLRFETDKAA
jgi:hypothetical protein